MTTMTRRPGAFRPGYDSRRHPGGAGGGRPPSAATVRRTILTALAADLPKLLVAARTLASAGDPQGVLACATLLAAALGGSTD